MMSGQHEAIITLRFLDWWLGGTGATGGGGADKVAHRDEWGCPALPASQVKGTLRESAELWAGWPADEVELYFGSRTEETKPGESVEGHLVFAADACLPADFRAEMEQRPALRACLFGQIPATAINPATGAAKDKSLRLIEACVPMELTLAVRWEGSKAAPQNWVERLDTLCALAPAFGALKQDGFGRAIASCVAASGVTAQEPVT